MTTRSKILTAMLFGFAPLLLYTWHFLSIDIRARRNYDLALIDFKLALQEMLTINPSGISSNLQVTMESVPSFTQALAPLTTIKYPLLIINDLPTERCAFTVTVPASVNERNGDVGAYYSVQHGQRRPSPPFPWELEHDIQNKLLKMTTWIHFPQYEVLASKDSPRTSFCSYFQSRDGRMSPMDFEFVVYYSFDRVHVGYYGNGIDAPNALVFGDNNAGKPQAWKSTLNIKIASLKRKSIVATNSFVGNPPFTVSDGKNYYAGDEEAWRKFDNWLSTHAME